MKKNRIWVALVTFALCTGLLLACGKQEKEKTTVDSRYQIVCTVFPAYDWVKEIAGENKEAMEITLLLDQGVDLHSYQPTAADMAKIAACDLFVYVGGESDEWVEDALKESANKDRKVICLMEELGDQVKEEELIEGMEAEEEEEEEEGPEYDEHVWLSLKNAKIFAESICRSLSEMDSANASRYEENRDAYLDKLTALDQKYQAAVLAGAKKTVVFGDRFPFRYLVDDYDLSYYAAFVGCSAETEASFETITFLANKIDELNLETIFVLESSNQKIAKTIVENTENKNQKIVILDAMQSTTGKDVANGVTYLSIMERNLSALTEGLK